MRGNLLDQVSQDLRNPLSNINMTNCMLKQVENEKDRDKYLLILQQEFDTPRHKWTGILKTK